MTARQSTQGNPAAAGPLLWAGRCPQSGCAAAIAFRRPAKDPGGPPAEAGHLIRLDPDMICEVFVLRESHDRQ